MDVKLQRLYGSIGAHVAHSRNDSRVMTERARAAAGDALKARLLAEIDEREPGLSEDERMARLKHATTAHFKGLRAKRGRK